MTTEFDARLATSGRNFGLLALRFAIGAAILQAGLLKLFDYGTVVESMEQSGWRMPQLAAFLVTAAESLGGIGLLLGLVTPLAAMAVLAAMIDAWAVNVSGAAFWSDPFNVPFLIGFGALALLFTGAGTFSLDERLWGRDTWPRLVSVTLLVVAVAAAVATWVLLNGTNPIHLSTPAG
ncbi:DoxX family protein [Mycolicibacterium chitae]|nr:DoxX family protein [Mycolicibacterium chitae]MCV7106611.1 DoxX family protein [Mycolicibacterium chitae]